MLAKAKDLPTPTRVLVTRMPQLLGDIVRSAIASQGDMVLCPETGARADLPRLLRDCGVDIVVVGCEEDELPGVEQEFLAQRRPVALVALTGDGRRSFLCRLAACTSALGTPSEDLLVRNIREAMEAASGTAPAPGEAEASRLGARTKQRR